jgi:hypothetical protein
MQIRFHLGLVVLLGAGHAAGGLEAGFTHEKMLASQKDTGLLTQVRAVYSERR